ncbi:MAG: hypothetical protein PHX29_04110 [Dehalococcoidales bacterium]|nr:hypothetical protein [Dehalococcoidales bacterium]
MVSNWQNSYHKLEEYLTNTPAIKIEPQSVFIPQDTKDAFYLHFDDVREKFLQEHFSAEISLGREISTQFKEIEAEVTGMLNIKREIRIAPPLRWFINDPVNGMTRPLLNLLFDLLKGKIDNEAFEELAKTEITELFKKQFSATYERLVVLALVKWLQPTRAFAMPLDDMNLYSSSQEGDSQYERINMPPDYSDLEEMVFDYASRVTYLAPEVIVYSPVVKKYVGIKTGFVGVAWHARLVSEQRDWLDQTPFHQIFSHLNPWPNILIYLDDEADNIKMVADKTRVCRPDYIIDTIATDKFFDSKTIQRIKAHNEMLKPFLGTAVVCQGEAPDEAFEILMPQPAEALVNPEEEPLQGENQDQSSNQAISIADTAIEDAVAEETPHAPPITIVNAGYDYTLMANVFSTMLDEDTSPEE